MALATAVEQSQKNYRRALRYRIFQHRILKRISSLNILNSKRFSCFLLPHIASYAIGQRSDIDVVVVEEVEVVLDVVTVVVVVVVSGGGSTHLSFSSLHVAPSGQGSPLCWHLLFTLLQISSPLQ